MEENLIFEENIDNKKLIIEIEDNITTDFNLSVNYNGTRILANCIINEISKDRLDFYDNIKIRYYEKYYSFGKIPNNFYRREDGNSKREIFLNNFLTDLFKAVEPYKLNKEIIINLNLIEYNDEMPPETPVSIAFSILIQYIFNYNVLPFSAFRIGKIEGKYIKNPGFFSLKYSNMDLIIAISEDNILNLNAFSKENTYTYIFGAIVYCKKIIDKFNQFQKKIIEKIKPLFINNICKKEEYKLTQDYNVILNQKIDELSEKENLNFHLFKFLKEIIKSESEQLNLSEYIIIELLLTELKKINFERLSKHIRLDKRMFNDFRKINSDVGFLPSTHGSTKLKLGNTEVLSTITLDGINKSKYVYDITGFHRQYLINHCYNYFLGLNQTELFFNRKHQQIQNDLYCDELFAKLIPPLKEHPYATRIVHEVFSDSGSSLSVGINSAILALRDGGIKISDNISSFDFALFFDKDNDIMTLSDPNLIEQLISDLNINVTLSLNGIYSLKLNVLNKPLKISDFETIFENKEENIKYFINKLNGIKETSNPEKKTIVPNTLHFTISPKLCGYIKGTRSKNIYDIMRKTKTLIQIDDDGLVIIVAYKKNGDIDAAKSEIMKLESYYKNNATGLKKIFGKKQDVINYYVGVNLDVVVMQLVPFGIFVETEDMIKGLIYLSELGDGTAYKPEDVVRVGDKIKVKLIEMDELEFKFSQKQYLEEKNK